MHQVCAQTDQSEKYLNGVPWQGEARPVSRIMACTRAHRLCVPLPLPDGSDRANDMSLPKLIHDPDADQSRE